MGNLFSERRESINRRNEEARRQLSIEAELRRQRAEVVQQQFVEQYRLQLLEQRRKQLLEQRRISTAWHSDDNPFGTSRAGETIIESVSRTERNSDRSVIEYITNHSTSNGWESMASCDTVKYVHLSPSSQEYMEIMRLFKNTNKKFFKVVRIERIQNPYLYGAYLLKEEEISSRLGQPEQRLLFHGTKTHNVDSICEDNFDWRMHGKGTGHRFGRGVSFSPISNYATHYCDKDSSVKIMLVVKVLISQACIGNPTMDLPPRGFDTTQKNDGHVIVKYYDNEYYPAYKLYFTRVGSDI